MPFEEIAAKMRQDWDQRARENARYYIVDSNNDWSETEFYALGQKTLADDILNDMYNVCQARNPVWPGNSIYVKQREIIPGVVDNETTRCQSAWTRSASC